MLSLVEHLKYGATLLTPSRRLCTYLINTLTPHLSSKKTLLTPPIFALEDWYSAIWDQFEITGKVSKELLTISQSHFKIDHIIQTKYEHPLFNTFETAKTVYDAWHILHHWQSLSILEAQTDNADQQSFQNWIRYYQNWLQENDFVDRAQLPQKILSTWQVDPHLTIWHANNKQIILFGFEDPTPLTAHFFDTLKTLNYKIEWCDPITQTPHETVRSAFSQPAQEILAAAHWCQSKLAKNQTMAVVVPNLPDKRQQIEKIFNDVCHPLSVVSPIQTVNPYFNISAAIPLLHYPIIMAAFYVIQNGMETIPYNLKVFFDEKVSPSKVSQAPQSYTQWSQNFLKILQQAGWPGNRSLTSIEHQVVKRFYALLQEFSVTSKVLSACTFAQACQTFQKLLSHTAFQAENKNAPIQILGVLETIGQCFDAMWVIGFDNQSWPPKAQPNPFIPAGVQRRLQMPHASPEREIQFAKKVTHRLQQSASFIQFSYCKQDNQLEKEVSELISAVKEQDYAPVLPARVENWFTPSLEIMLDENGPVYPHGSANSTMLTLQANCPFKAFAQIRLKIQPPEMLSVWIQPQQVGVLLHSILEKFWNKIKNSRTLRKYEDDKLHSWVIQLIEQGIQQIVQPGVPEAYIQVEKQRLLIIFKQYIALEKQRDFEVVAVEAVKKLTLAGLHFTLRVDRIDKLVTGEHVIVDYKSGGFQYAFLFGDRIRSPQLPLYFLATHDSAPQALQVIKLSNPCETIDLTSADIQKYDPVMLNKWDDLRPYWKDRLTLLAEDFKQGKAKVDPVDSKACHYCHCRPICRVKESV